MDIILASASPRRSELLKQLGIGFKVFPSNIEENIDEMLGPEELVQNLSYSKAFNVAEGLKNGLFANDTLVIGADTVVVKGHVLGKPRDESEAFRMLKTLQNGWHEVITGLTLVHIPSFSSITGYEKTWVKIRSMSDDMIYAYVKTGEPMDKAGAYGIQGMGALLVERIEGCYFNVVGLPLMKLGTMLGEYGVKIL